MIRKHPLFWKEWKSAKWWSTLIMVIFFIMFLSINNTLQYMKELVSSHEKDVYLEVFSIFERYFSDGLVGAGIAILPIVIVISALLFQSDRKAKIGAFVSSLPFTKKEQFKVKWCVGLKVITIPFAITSLLTILMRLANWGWIKGHYAVSATGDKMMAHDTLPPVMLTLLQTYLFFIALYSFLMLVQTLIGNNIAASVIGVIVLAVPWFVIETGKTTLWRMLDRPIRLYNHENWSFFYTLMMPARDYIDIDTTMGLSSTGVFSYDYYWFKILVLLLIIGISLYGGIQFYGRNENSRNGQLAMFDWTGKILVIGVTICVALLGNNVIRVLFIENTSLIYELMSLAISGFIGYIVINKILDLAGGVQDD